MLPDRVSNPGPLTYESGALLIALRGPAYASLKKIYPLVQKIFHLQAYDLKNEVKLTKI